MATAPKSAIGFLCERAINLRTVLNWSDAKEKDAKIAVFEGYFKDSIYVVLTPETSVVEVVSIIAKLFKSKLNLSHFRLETNNESGEIKTVFYPFAGKIFEWSPIANSPQGFKITIQPDCPQLAFYRRDFKMKGVCDDFNYRTRTCHHLGAQNAMDTSKSKELTYLL